MTTGQQVMSDDVYRGEVLVRPYEEWDQSYRSFMRARLTFDLVAVLTLGTAFFITAYWLSPLLGVSVVFGVAVVAVAELLSYRATVRTLTSGGNVPALYDAGVEMPMFPLYAIKLFIPWHEISDAWVRRSRLLDDMLFISIKGSRWRWRVPGRLLGEDGLQVAMTRARTPAVRPVPSPVQEAPRLVLYSAEGAKSESKPEDA
jgi:hypothetical protein